MHLPTIGLIGSLRRRLPILAYEIAWIAAKSGRANEILHLREAGNIVRWSVIGGQWSVVSFVRMALADTFLVGHGQAYRVYTVFSVLCPRFA